MCPSDDYTADIDNDGISDCRDADGLECTPDPTASCDGGIYAGVVGECVVMMDVLIVLMISEMNVHLPKVLYVFQN